MLSVTDKSQLEGDDKELYTHRMAEATEFERRAGREMSVRNPQGRPRLGKDRPSVTTRNAVHAQIHPSYRVNSFFLRAGKPPQR
jgi:hypothetical protein